METKMRYKRRKVKKHWVTVAVATTALMLGGAVSTQVSADSVSDQAALATGEVVSTTAEQKADETTTDSSASEEVRSGQEEVSEESSSDTSVTKTQEATTAQDVTTESSQSDSQTEVEASTSQEIDTDSQTESLVTSQETAASKETTTGIQTIDGKTYYIAEDGTYKTNFVVESEDGKLLYFGKDGVLEDSTATWFSSEGLTSLNDTFSENNAFAQLDEKGIELVDGYLTANTWYRPNKILSNGEQWLPARQTDVRPLLMAWWPDKQTQLAYVNYMAAEGFGDIVQATASQEELNKAAQDIQKAIEKKIYVDGTAWLRETISKFVATQPNWNSQTEDNTAGKNQDHLQGGALTFINSDKTPEANSDYRLFNETITKVTRDRDLDSELGAKAVDELLEKYNNLETDGYELLLANDIDNSNPVVQAEQLNWLHFIMNFGEIVAGDASANFDGVRVDAVDNVNADLLQIASDYFKAKYGVADSEANAINHLSILEAWSENDPYYNEAMSGAQLPIDNKNRLSLLYSLMRPIEGDDSRTPSLAPIITNSYNNRSSEIDPTTGKAYKDGKRMANYMFVRAHDSEVQTVIAKIINKELGRTDTDGLTNITLDEIKEAFKIYNEDMNQADKKYTQFNVPAAYALMLTNKDAITRVYYGDMYTDDGQYMATKSPYYDSIETLLKGRIKYVSGGQDMQLHYPAGANESLNNAGKTAYDRTELLTSVRYGKGADTAEDLGTEETRYSGILTIVSNNPKLELYQGDDSFANTITVNMGAAHKNQAYRPLLLGTENGILQFASDQEASAYVKYTDYNGNLTFSPSEIKGYATVDMNGYLAVWVPVGASDTQDVRVAASTEKNSSNLVYESSAALDSQVIYEGFSNFQDFVENDAQYTNKLIAQNADLFKSWGITSFEMAPQYVSSEDGSFLDAIILNGYAFEDRYDIAMSKNNKYGSLNDLLDAVRSLHAAGIQVIADWVPDQIYNLPGEQIVTANRTDSYGNYRSGAVIKELLYAAKTRTNGDDYQALYGGAFLEELAEKYPEIFERVQVSSGQKIDPTVAIKQWEAKYFNGTNILGRGAYYVLKDWGSNDYFKVDENTVILPKQLLGQEAVTGFAKDDTGYYYYSTSGSRAKSVFIQDENGNWYYFDENGYMVTGAYQIGDDYYRFLPNGVQLRDAFVMDASGNYYYYSKLGAQYRNDYYLFDSDWRYFDANGVMARGIVSINGSKQYFDTNGFQQKDVAVRDADGNLYYFEAGSGNAVVNRWFEIEKGSGQFAYAGSDGKAVVGSQVIDGKSYYFQADGTQVKGTFVTNSDGSQSYYDADSGELYVSRFFQVGDSWYYADSVGQVVTGSQTINGQRLYFATDGKQVKGDFVTNSDGSQSYYDADSGELYVSRFFQVGDSWYYADSTGQVVTGSQTINGQRLYFATDGKQVKGDFVINSDGSQSYYDADSGELYVSRFFQVGDSWYYADSTGQVVTGSQTINGQRLYFTTDGKQVKGNFVTNSDGSQSYYDADSGELYVSRFFQVGDSWYYANRAGRVVKLSASTRTGLSLKKKDTVDSIG